MLISKIRKYSWLAAGSIALCLIGFLVQSATRSGTGMFNTHKAPKYASVAGEEITREEFEARKSESTLEYLTFNNLILQAEQGQYQMDAKTQFGVSEQAWTDFVNERMIDRELADLGLTITDDEFSNLIYGPDPHPVIKNYYIGLSKTGQYDASLLPQFVNQISDQKAQQENQQLRQEYYQFISREKVAKRDYLQNKYMSLFTQSVYVPEWLAKRNYVVGNSRSQFTFTFLPYTDIVDSTIVASDSDLKNYFNANKNKFKQTEGRVLEYISWPFLPTGNDSSATLNNLMETATKMKAAKNDSTFIATRSEDDDRFGMATYSRSELEAKGISPNILDSIFTKPVGSFVGPYFNSGAYKIAKIKSRSNMPDSVDCKHILISINENRDSTTAKHLADSLQILIAGGADFAQLVSQYSEDQGSKDKGGELGWITPATNFVPEFKDYLFRTGAVGAVGEIKTTFGYHLIVIKEMKSRKEFVTIAVLGKKINPSKETIDSIEKAASDFYGKSQNPEAFDKNLADLRLMKKTTQPLAKNLFEIPGLDNSREIITWSFDAQKNEFKYFSMTDFAVVAYLKEIKVDGVPELENVRDQVEQEVIKEKKADILKKKIEDAMKGATSLEAVAAKLNTKVDSVTNASLSQPYAPIIGLEPKVIGAAFATEAGKMSKTIDGNRGVYVVMGGIPTPAPEAKDYTMNKNQLTYSIQNKYQPQSVLNELKEKAKVVDNRYQFGD